MVKVPIEIATAVLIVAGLTITEVGAYDIDLQKWLEQSREETPCPMVEGMKWAMSVPKESRTCQSALRMLASRSRERQAKAFALAPEAIAAIPFPYDHAEMVSANQAIGPLADALLRNGQTQLSIEERRSLCIAGVPKTRGAISPPDEYTADKCGARLGGPAGHACLGSQNAL